MLNYIIQVILFQSLFLVVYDLALSKETFFNKNRWYLIGTIILSFVLPLIRITTVQETVNEEYLVLLPEIILSPEKVIEQQQWYQSIDYLDIVFWLGLLVFLSIFLIKVKQLFTLVYKNHVTKKEGYSLVALPKSTKAFSFFSYIFLGENITDERKEKIIAHELVHIQQKHSLDLLFLEILKIVMWFNPIVRIYQKRITLVHEFLSDEIVSKTANQGNYINNLLSEVFQVQEMSFVNQFYKNSLIKKRIVMMTKSRSKQSKQLKYLVLIPVLISMLFYTACSEKENISISPVLETQKIFTSLDKKPVETDRQSYMDFYMGDKLPNTKEYLLEELTEEEKEEFLAMTEKFKDNSTVQLKIFEGLNNRKVVAFSLFINKSELGKYERKQGDMVPMIELDVFPTFPGCSDGDKDCFSKSMIAYVKENFDVSLADNLNLRKGKQRIFVKFKITKTGNIEDIEVRAPHPDLKSHAEQLAKNLPQMKPGEKDNKVVNVGYVLPITFNVQ
ncbi:M56 family metallopeptidase [uncultured Tenacibaculum sp.]|uniref:M56 family metallopeptidase n=1 Tax=uncultured Tenacibaculum sp. TaxID=174713 RepID=UPI002636C0AD|nr:M56 family metallopeptidase [uncultured Tenacibaculum sp.]